MRLIRVARWLGVGSLSMVGGLYAVCEFSEVKTLGVVRFGRAAITISEIVFDYQKSMRGFDKQTEAYSKSMTGAHSRSAQRLLDLCYRNGGAFIKVGQHLGTLHYLIPQEYVLTLSVLHSKAPESSLDEIKNVIKKDLGRDPDEIFTDFDSKPLGTASLAQVHKAKLRDGQVVAVKVQHPMVRDHSRMDMACMELLVKIVARIFPDFHFTWLAEETRKNLPKELDFAAEAHNAEMMAKRMKMFPYLKIPWIHWDLTTGRVLTMEFCEGSSVTDVEFLKKNGISGKRVSERLARIYSEMIFVQGVVHCDPHPGNILISPGKGGKDDPQIVLLDHGLYATLTPSFRIAYCQLWLSLLHADVEGIKKWSSELNCGRLYGLLACMVSGRSWKALTSGIQETQFTDEESSEIQTNAGINLSQITLVLNQVPREMLLIFKTNDLLRGIEHRLGALRYQALSFLVMSRCCVQAVSRSRLEATPQVTWWCQCRIYISLWSTLFTLTLYERWLRLKQFAFRLGVIQ